MKISTLFSVLRPAGMLFALIFWHTHLTAQMTMTFDSGPSHPGFTFAGWSGMDGFLFPSSAGVGDIAQITRNELTWDLVSFETAPFGNGNGPWLATSDKGDTYQFVPNSLPATHTLNWVGISWLRVSLINIGEGGNQSFNFDNVVYFENNSPVCNITLDGVSKFDATCCLNTGLIIVTPVTCECVGDIEYSVNNGATWQTDNFFDGLAPGNYTVKIRDGGNPGCVASYIGNPVVVSSITETTAPVAVCRDLTIILSTSGIAGITADQLDDASTDNCGIGALSLSQNSFTCDDLGANAVTLTVTDHCGNTATCTANVTVLPPPDPDNPCGPPATYNLTLIGNVLTITDNAGNGDVLTVNQDGTGIRFETAAERTYRLNDGLPGNFPVVIPALASLSAVIINAGAGNDTINIGNFTAAMPSLTINGGKDHDEVNFNGDITFAPNAGLDMDLQNDDILPGIDRVTLAFNANLLLSGTGTAVVKVSCSVTFNSNSSLETQHGDLTIEANRQATSTAGNFKGVSLGFNTIVRSSGNGKITVKGTGGNADDNINAGVSLSSGKIHSFNGDVMVEGRGGGSGASIFNYGIELAFGGEISSGGSGKVWVKGEGGNTTGSNEGRNYGIVISQTGAKITSFSSDVNVEGTGGGNGFSHNNYGVVVFSDGEISAGGNGKVTVKGTGGNPGGFSNRGVYVSNPNARITSGGGDVSITAIEGGSGPGLMVEFSGAITTAANGGNIILVTNTIHIESPSSISTQSGSSVTLTPYTHGMAINLGSTSDPGAGPLSLSDNELDRITTGTLIIGSDTCGAITVSAGITRPAATDMQLISGGDVVIGDGMIHTAGGDLLLHPGNSPAAVKPVQTGIDVDLGTGALSFGSDLAIVINGNTPGNGTGSTYTRLTVNGAVDLTGVNLVLSGSHQPTGAETFLIVSNDGGNPITGTFAGLPEGFVLHNVFGNNRPVMISYTGGDGNDVVMSTLSDYAIMADGNSITVTDLSGNGDELNISQAGDDIRFSVIPESRTYSVNGGPVLAFTTPADISLANVTGITINAGAGDDVINMGGFSATLPALIINGGTENDIVNLNGDLNLVANANLGLDLQNDDPVPGIDRIVLASEVNVILSGSGTAFIKVSRDVLMNPGSSIETENGNLFVEANQQTVPTSGNFTGVLVGGVIRSNGSGQVSVKGIGGNTGNSQHGIRLLSGGRIEGGTGNVTVTGIGGASTDAVNIGIMISGVNSRITSSGGDVLVEGIGGGGSGSSGFGHNGIYLSSEGMVTAGGNGKVEIKGTGGNSTGGLNDGIFIQNAKITSSGGDVIVEGTGDGSGNASANAGIVLIAGGEVSAGGNGTVSVKGTGANTTGIENAGLVIGGGNARITSAGGDISVSAFEGSTGIGLDMGAGSAITTAVHGGNITIGSRSMDIRNSASITTQPDGEIRLFTGDNFIPIDLGSSLDPVGGPLSLTDAELDRFTTGTLVIGNIHSGIMTISDAITRAAPTHVWLLSGSNIVFNQGFSTAGGNLQLSPGNAPNAVYPDFAGTDVTAGTLSFTNPVAIKINGTIPGNGTGNTYTRLTVNGQVDLTGTGLLFSHTYTPAEGDQFIIIDNDGTDPVTGTFNGFPEGAVIPDFLGSGLFAAITYSGGNGNDVVLTIGNEITCYPDADGDGYGVADESQVFIFACGPGYATNALDCDDTDPAVNPGASEVCYNSLDDNCDGNTDENCTPHYTVTTADHTIWITDAAGSSEPLSVNDDNGSIRFHAAGRMYSLNGGPLQFFPLSISLDDVTSIVIDAATGNDTIHIGAFASTLPSLSIYGGGGDDIVNFNGDITFAAGAHLNMNLQDDAPVPGVDNVALASGVNLMLSGDGSAIIKVSRHIVLESGSSILTEDGDLIMEANQQATPTPGNFVGVVLNGGLLTSTGEGMIVVKGKGGNTGGGKFGVHISNAGRITGGTAASDGVFVEGMGGAGTGGDNGVFITGENSMITSSGSEVSVKGTGGGISNSGAQRGVFIQNNGAISAGGNGRVTVEGIGGTAIFGSINHGILLDNGHITSSGGDVEVTGAKGGGATSIGIVTLSSGTITTAIDGGDITLIANSMSIDAPVSAGPGNNITLRPQAPGLTIDLGAATDVSGGPLSLSDTELDHVTGGTIIIGSATAGAITISDDISRALATAIELHSAGNIVISDGVTGDGAIHTAGGDLLLHPGGSPAAVYPSFSGTDVILGNGTLSFGSDLAIVINGTTPGNGEGSTYTRLTVAGSIDLTGVDLELGGNYMPVIGHTFLIVDNDGIEPVEGIFTDLPEGAEIEAFLGSALHAMITYTGGDGNDVTLTLFFPCSGDEAICPGSFIINEIAGPVTLQGAVPAGGEYTGSGVSGNMESGYVFHPGLAGTGTHMISYAFTDENGCLYTCTFFITVEAAPDYSITTTGNHLVITDIAGNGDTLSISEAAGNIRFAAVPGVRTYSINGGPVMPFTTPADIPLSGLNAVTINTGAGNDIISSGAFTASLPGLTVNGGTGDDEVIFTGDIHFAENANLDLDLRNNAPVPGEDRITVEAGANLVLAGTGTAILKVRRNVFVNFGGSIETENGELFIEANFTGVSASGFFNGVEVNGGLLGSTGTGAVTVRGKGGNTGEENYGVWVRDFGQITGGTMDPVTVWGIGGEGPGAVNGGVHVVNNGAISSMGSNIVVTGSGGGNSNSEIFNFGILIGSASEISAGGDGTVTVHGNGGRGTLSFGVGIIGTTARITSSNGNVQVTGNGGAILPVIGPVTDCHGIYCLNGNISAGGNGALVVQGAGSIGFAGNHHGVFLWQGSAVTSSGGPVTITGAEGGGPGSKGIFLQNTSAITTATHGGNIRLVANIIDIIDEAYINTPVADSVTIHPLAVGGSIVLGSVINIAGGPLSLSDDELDRITCGTLIIGNTAGSNITISAPITRPAPAQTWLRTGGDIVFNEGFATGGGSLLVTPGVSPKAVYPDFHGTDVSLAGGSLAFSGNLHLIINGITPGNSGPGVYTQLTMDGIVDLAGANLNFSGNYTPSSGETFVIVNNTGMENIAGAFTGLPEGHLITNFLDSGFPAVISYEGGDGNDVVITVLAPDYTIADVNGAIVITDISGHADNLVITQDGSNIRFSVTPAERSYSVNGGAITTFVTPATVSLTGATSITINPEGGNDQINVSGLTDLPSLTINGGAGDDEVFFNGDITFLENAHLNVDMQNDNDPPGEDRMVIAADANLILTGDGSAVIRVSRNVLLSNGASLETIDGDIIIEANRQAVPTGDNFSGVEINNAAVKSSGSGNVFVRGTGGNSTANANRGVFVTGANARITSFDGDVSVEGAGAGSGASSFNAGVRVAAGGEITTDGSGKLYVTGAGGHTTGNANIGVYVSDANGKIGALHSDVYVEGNAGGSGGSAENYGIFVQNAGQISSGGSGNVTVAGNGGTATGNFNRGIFVADPNSRITSSGGDIHLTGIRATGGTGIGLLLLTSGSITTTDGGNITIVANSVDIANTTGVSTQDGGSVTITPYTGGMAINLGSAANPFNGPLGLSDEELDRIITERLIIGSDTAGTVTVNNDITRPSSTDLQVTSSGDVVIGDGVINTAGGNLLLHPGNSPAAVYPGFSGIDADLDGGALSFGGDLVIVINGPAPGNGTGSTYTQLTVTGIVDLDGVALVFDDNYVPEPGQLFVIVDNDGMDTIIGRFTGLPEGTLLPDFLGSGLDAVITYAGGTGNDVVITVQLLPDYLVTTSGNIITISDVSGNSDELHVLQDGSSIQFSTTQSRIFSFNGLLPQSFPVSIALTGIDSIVINAGAGNDIISFGAFTTALPDLVINGGTGNDEIHFNGNITFKENAGLDADLQNDDTDPGTDNATIADGVNIVLTGEGEITIRVSHDVTIGSGSGVETVNGDITIAALMACDIANEASVITHTGSITVMSNRLSFSNEASLSTMVSGSVILLPYTAGTGINLGSGADPAEGPVGLSDAELDIITTGTLFIGSDTSGTIIVSDDITRPDLTNVHLVSGGDIVINSGTIHTTGGDLFFHHGASPAAVYPAYTGIDANTGNGTLFCDNTLGIAINGVIPGDGTGNTHTQLIVTGMIDLNGVNLSFTGSYIPVTHDTFLIIDNSQNGEVTGTFNGLPEGGVIQNFRGSGKHARITYMGGAENNDVMLTIFPPDYAIIIDGGHATITDISGNSETLNMTNSFGDNIVFSTSLPRTFTINDGPMLTSVAPVSLAGVTDLTINAGAGHDTIHLEAFDSFMQHLTINGGTGNDVVRFDDDFHFEPGFHLDLDLQNDDEAPGEDRVIIGFTARVRLFGDGTAVVKTSRDVFIDLAGSIETQDGDLVIEANRQAIPTPGNFSGIDLNGGGLRTTGSGAIRAKGNGGASMEPGDPRHGIAMRNFSFISCEGAGVVILEGAGGTGPGNHNHGVDLGNNNVFILSSGGAVEITGIEGDGTDSKGIVHHSMGSISAAAPDGHITLIANSIDIQSMASINTDAGQNVVIRPYDVNIQIDLGAATDIKGGPLSLSHDELGRITAGTLMIGDSNSGAITVSDMVTLPAPVNIQLTSGDDIRIVDGGINTGGGTLLLDPGALPAAVKPLYGGTDVTAGMLSFGSALEVMINGIMPGNGTAGTYTQLTVAGQIDLDGVDLVFTGDHIFSEGEIFMLVDNDSDDPVSGFFNGLPEGTLIPNFENSGFDAIISYTGETGNDVVLTIATPAPPDYTITTSGNHLVITDVSGNSETLTVSENGAGIRFSVSGRRYSIDGQYPAVMPADLAIAGLNAITINTAAGNDTIVINGFTAALPDLTIHGGIENDEIVFNGDITFAPGAGLDVDLQNDDDMPGVDRVIFSSATTLVLSGTGTAIVRASRDVRFENGSGIETENGDLIIEANQQEIPPGGEFTGVYLFNSQLQSTGEGAVSVRGKGESTDSGQYGVWLAEGSTITGGIAPVTVEGTGGDGLFNVGVYMTGTGSMISSAGSDVYIAGMAGGTEPLSNNFGVLLSNSAVITAGGNGTVTVQGSGDDAAGFTTGVAVFDPGSMITSSGGAVNVTGIEGSGSDDIGLAISSSGAITTALHDGAITLTANSMNLGTVSSGAAGSVTLLPYTGGTPIDLGSNGDPAGGPLSLSILEFSHITAGTLIIGDEAAGQITVHGMATSAPTDLFLVSGDDILFSGEGINTAGGMLMLQPGVSPAAVKPVFNGMDIAAGELTINGNLEISINGGTPGDGAAGTYSQLVVAGDVDLDGAGLVITGNHTFTAGEVFVIIENLGMGATTGSFSGLPEGSVIFNINGSGLDAIITYTGNTGNDVLLTITTTAPPDYFVSTTGDHLMITDLSGHSETLVVSESGAHIQLQAPGRTYSLDGGFPVAMPAGLPLSEFSSISIHTAVGNDTIVVGEFSAPLPKLAIYGGAGNDMVLFNGDITFMPDDSLIVELQAGNNDPETDRVVLAAGTHLALTGAGAAFIQASHEVSMQPGSTIETANSNITLIADSMSIESSASISTAISHNVNLRPYSQGRPVDLGNGTADGALGLSDAELDRISTGTLIIGDGNSGPVTVSADITRMMTTHMQLFSGGDIEISEGTIHTAGGDLLLHPGNSPAAVKPFYEGTDVACGMLSFGSDLALVISGTTPGNGMNNTYSQLIVAGMINLTGVDLVITDSYMFSEGDSFIIIDNNGVDAVMGTFNGLQEGDLIPDFLGSGLDAVITYTGGDGNDVMLTMTAQAPPDYAITTAGNHIIITDIAGNSDALSVDQDGGSIRFTTAVTRQYSLNGGPLASLPANVSLMGVDSITIHAGAGNDIIYTGGFSAALPAVVINGGTGDDEAHFLGNITFAEGAGLDVNLQNDDDAPGTDRIIVGANANLLLSGTGAAVLKASRDIMFGFGSSIETEDGDLTVEANQQAEPAAGDFAGIHLFNGHIRSSGSGIVTVKGKGGNGTVNQHGIWIELGGKINGGSGGTTIIEGRGGTGDDTRSCGVFISSANSSVSSSGSDVVVTGYGGGTETSSSNDGILLSFGGRISAGGNGTVTVSGTGGSTQGSGNDGIEVTGNSSSISSSGGDVLVTGAGGAEGTGNNTGILLQPGGAISAGGNGTLTVAGTGGAGEGFGNHGIQLFGPNASVASVGGDVSVTGQGGGAGDSGFNVGIYGSDCTISAGGTGSVTIAGTGGLTEGIENPGVYFLGENTTVTSSGGDIQITGIEGGGIFSPGFRLVASAVVTTAIHGGHITLVANSMDISEEASVSADANHSVTLFPYTGGTPIELGQFFQMVDNTLHLSDEELDLVSGGTLIIGHPDAGEIMINGDVTRALPSHMELHSSGDVVIGDGVINTGGGNLLLHPGPSPAAVKPVYPETDVICGTLSFGSDLEIMINGTTPGDGSGGAYTQLSVEGMIDLNGVDLVFSGPHVPAIGDTFLIVNNDNIDGINGTFNGLAEGALIPNFLGSFLTATITYSGGDGNDVVIRVVCLGYGNTIYVDASATTGANTGLSWTDAFLSLQDALGVACSCQNVTEIWVAAGAYYPDDGAGRIADERTSAFQLCNGVAIYGGFAGDEDGLGDRDIEANITILSGDLLQDDGPGFENNGDNALHVVTGEGTDGSAVLDGFTISGGHANGEFFPDDAGGGIYLVSGANPPIRNCTLSANMAVWGGGMFTWSSAPAITGCSFSGNSASYGGAMFNFQSFPVVTDCSFSGNVAVEEGHAMYNSGGAVEIHGDVILED